MNNEIICYCSNTTRADIIKALDNGAKTLKDIQNTTGACTKGLCKEMNPKGLWCSKDIMQVIADYNDINKKKVYKKLNLTI